MNLCSLKERSDYSWRCIPIFRTNELGTGKYLMNECLYRIERIKKCRCAMVGSGSASRGERSTLKTVNTMKLEPGISNILDMEVTVRKG